MPDEEWIKTLADGCADSRHAIHANFIGFVCRRSVDFKQVSYASLHRRLDVPTFAMVPCATDRKRVYHGTRFPSVLSSFSYTAGLRHSFKELKGIGARD